MGRSPTVLIPIVGSITGGAVVTFFGWAALHLAPQTRSWQWATYPGGILAMPGALFCVILAAIFSPQGFHGGDDFSWTVIPANLFFYSTLFFLVLRRFRRNNDDKMQRGN